jgi:hypothetical protein
MPRIRSHLRGARSDDRTRLLDFFDSPTRTCGSAGGGHAQSAFTDRYAAAREAARKICQAAIYQSNLDIKTGEPIPADDRRMIYQLANMLWHSDSPFKPVPSLVIVHDFALLKELPAGVARRRSGRVGQPLRAASRDAVRRDAPPAPDAAHDDRRRSDRTARVRRPRRALIRACLPVAQRGRRPIRRPVTSSASSRWPSAPAPRTAPAG